VSWTGTFVRRPQTLGLRRVLVQVHLWLGIGAGLYVILICLTGSLIIFRRELDRNFCSEIVTAADGRRVSVLCKPAVVTGLAELHDHLLGARTGLFVNGVGAMVVMLMCLTGAILWWPGKARWRHAVMIRRNVSGPRFIWELHSVLGLWLILLVVLWAATGIYFAFPRPFNALIEFFTVNGADTPASRSIEDTIAWFVRLHFGRAYGLGVKVIWAILGLAPIALVVTGALMWWNRVVRPSLRRHGPPAP
jgi:uncharacterized iron-regulated membrane protein